MEERIKYLFKQYLNNTCTRKEFDEFFSYINEAAHNELIRELIKKAYEETRQPGSFLTYVDELGNLVVTKPNWNEQSLTTAKPAKKKRLILAMAVVVIALVAGVGWFMTRPLSKQPLAAIKGLAKKMTGRSEYRYMLLPDSTQVWLNAASTLEYPQQFATGKREVYLTGEAYFDVKHADKQPFLIHTGKVTTMVLGTAFNINAYPGRENIIVSVSRGKVRVNYNEKEMAVLTQGQQVKVSNTSNTVVQKKMAITEAAPWQQGNLQYDDETIRDIVADLERNYDVTIQVQSETLANERITTSFRREIGIENALKVICNLTDTRLKLENNKYVIQ
jgi:ferric-dicitrate binding protein FerR (iron transport regulator)